MKLDCGSGGNREFPDVRTYKTLMDPTFNAQVSIDIRRPLNHQENFILASITDLPFRSATFDFAVASHVLEHLPSPELARQACREMKRVASRGRVIAPSLAKSAWGDHHLIWWRGRFWHYPWFFKYSFHPFTWLMVKHFDSTGRYLTWLLKKVSANRLLGKFLKAPRDYDFCF